MSQLLINDYLKQLDLIKKIEIRLREEITTIEQIQAKTHEFQSRFE